MVQRIHHKVQITRFLSDRKQIKQTTNEDLSYRISEVVVVWWGLRLLMSATTGEVVNPCGVFVWSLFFVSQGSSLWLLWELWNSGKCFIKESLEISHGTGVDKMCRSLMWSSKRIRVVFSGPNLVGFYSWFCGHPLFIVCWFGKQTHLSVVLQLASAYRISWFGKWMFNTLIGIGVKWGMDFWSCQRKNPRPTENKSLEKRPMEN